MVRLHLKFSPTANANFNALDEILRQRIVEKIRYFLENEIKPEPLEGNFAGYYKLRVGDYRIVYTFEDQITMRVRRIGHRSTIYRDLARD
jgi:mRNA interferase RelE/StbE